MAGANETPRNKLIALMYLVFITMLALNVSKEVLVGFGQIFEKVSENNKSINKSNKDYYQRISDLAVAQPEQWVGNDVTAKKVRESSQEYFDFIEDIKSRATEKLRETDPDLKDFQKMDKGETLNAIFFDPQGITEEGRMFVDKMNQYKADITQVFTSRYPQYQNLVEQRFENGDFDPDSDFGVVVDKEGVKIPWLKYHFEGFPLISSLAKLTFLQNSIRSTENDVLNALLGRTLTESNEVNEKNYITLLKTSKGAYYQGEKFDGNIILGRKAGAAKPNDVDLKIDGRKLAESQYEKIDGGIILNISAGSPGDHQITGDLIFEGEKGPNKISVDQSFAVISKPNAAVISADKMNVVYRGVSNPMTISIPGISDDKIRASAPGLKKSRGSKYNMFPGKGREVLITASGKLPDGQTVSTKTKFRIKNLPAPVTAIRKQTGSLRMNKASILKARVGAQMPDDFDFALKLNVVKFKVRVPGNPTITCNGSKLCAKAAKAIKSARSGQQISIVDLTVQNPASPKYKFKRVAPLLIQIL